ncbi:MAG: hypothetical protein JW797_03645 [Bradymonadales bacterium]|nr:hypothetical protein [Bradymonadales bacterium]
MSDGMTIFFILALSALFFLYLGRRGQVAGKRWEDAARRVTRGPVPGYSCLPGKFVRMDPAGQPTGLRSDLTVVSMETIHANQRSRLVLTVSGGEPEDTELFTLMKTMALRLQRRTGSHVVAVQFLPEGTTDANAAVLIYSPDGRGWTGTTNGATLTVDLPGREPFRMAG